MLLAIATALAAVGGARAGRTPHAAANAGRRTAAVIASAQTIGPGTTLMRVRRPPRGDATEAFVIRVDLRNPKLRPGLLYPGRIAAVQPLSRMARSAGALAAVNGDFFNIGLSGAPVGPVVSGGQLLKGPERGRDLVAGVGIDGIGRVADVWLRGEVTLPGGATRVVSVLNDAAIGPKPMLDPNGIALFTRRWGAYPLIGAVRGLHHITEVVVAHDRVRRVRRLRRASGRRPIPAHGYILVGAGSGGRSLARLRHGQLVAVTSAQGTDAPAPFRFALGGKYRLLDHGHVRPRLPGGPGKPRTAVGFAHHGHELFLTVTLGPKPGVPGLSLSQEGRLLRSLGVSDAIALDDGGSSTMVARRRPAGPLRLVTQPSDDVERAVANGIALFAIGRRR